MPETKEAKRKVERIPTKTGAMTEGAKQGFEIMLDEMSKVRTEVNNLSSQIASQGHRLEVMETATAQTLEMVNKINDKLENGQVEQKAAVMDAFQKFAGSKIGKIVIILFLICGGLSVAYVVEHASGVSQIAESVIK